MTCHNRDDSEQKMSQRYRISEPHDLLRHRLDSMAALFQKSSGITHIIAEPVPEILKIMGSDVMTSEEIASKLTEKYDVEEGIEVGDIILARLDELRILGLVERVSE